MARSTQTDEELTPIRPGSAIRHTQDALAGMFQVGVELVFESTVSVSVVVVDGCPACAGAGGVAALDHEVGDYACDLA